MFKHWENEVQHRMFVMENTLNDYEYHYRVLDNPIVTDEQYDSLLKEYKELAKQYPQYITPNSPLNKIGSVLTDGFEKFEHKHVMGSLENTYSLEELDEWFDKLEEKLGTKSLLFIVEDKYDGISGSLIYKNGVLINSATRGDGKIGDDITNNAKQVVNIPLKFNDDLLCKTPFIEVRGEFLILKKDVDRINKLENTDFKNPRNLVSGTMKSLDSNIVKNRFVYFVPYYYYDEEGNALEDIVGKINRSFHTKCFDYRHHLDINMSRSQVKKLISELENENSESYFRNRIYPVDGAVIKLQRDLHRKKLGYSNNCPNWAKAFKYKQEKAITTVKDITWQVGRDRITPVAELEPVELEGTTVSRATLHNITQLERLNVTKGCKVEIEKAGFIIPYVNKVVETTDKNIHIPEKCPICGSDTKIIEIGSKILTCTNDFCKAKLKANIQYSVNALEIDEIGESLISELVDKELVKTPLDILKLSELQLSQCERMGKTKINKILRNVKKAVVQPLSKVIEFLGIKEVGKLTSEKLADNFNSLIDLSDTEKLLSINDIGCVIANNIISYIKQNTEYLLQVNQFFIVRQKSIKASNKLENKNFVVTGKATKGRDEIEKLIKNNGGNVSGSVTSKTDILIIGSLEESNFNSTKKKKAIELNKEIHDELWLFDLLDIKEEKEVTIEKEFNNKTSIDLNELF